MDNLLIILPAFIFTIALLVAIHEFGHFWVARKLNVKVLRFSIGFGKPLYCFRGKQDSTEYMIASIPLGGYVKMLDEREGEVPREELHRAFTQKSVYSRFAIVFAGPFVNFVFAVFAFWLMFVIGVQGVKPVMGKLDTDSIAWQSGLRNGDTIIAVDGVETPTLGAVYEQLLEGFIERKPVKIILSDQRELTFKLDQIDTEIEPSRFQDVIGLSLRLPKEQVIIGEVTQGSPAAKAGIQAGDQIISVDGQNIDHWRDLVRSVINRPGQTVAIEIERNNRRQTLDVTIGSAQQDTVPLGALAFVLNR